MKNVGKVSLACALCLFAASSEATNPGSVASAGSVAAALASAGSVAAPAPSVAATSAAAGENGAWPTDTSPEPHANEWDTATSISLARVSGGRASACIANRVREWLRVRCPPLRMSAGVQLAGETVGTRFGIDPAGKDGTATGGEVVLPLRRNERRVVMLWGLGPGYDGPLTVVPRVVLQTDWSNSAPTITLNDAVHEPVRTAQSERRRAEAPPGESPGMTW